jgi:hypothetical protein
MTDNDAWLYQISFKTAGQTLINLRGSSKEELSAALEMVQELAADISTTETVVGVLQPVGAHRAPAAAQPQAAPTPPPAGAPPAGPSVTPPVCAHGLPAKFVAGGVSKKTNRPYKAFWACGQEQAYQCDFRQDG